MGTRDLLLSSLFRACRAVARGAKADAASFARLLGVLNVVCRIGVNTKGADFRSYTPLGGRSHAPANVLVPSPLQLPAALPDERRHPERASRPKYLSLAAIPAHLLNGSQPQDLSDRVRTREAGDVDHN
jgi:hypothetical protein